MISTLIVIYKEMLIGFNPNIININIAVSLICWYVSSAVSIRLHVCAAVQPEEEKQSSSDLCSLWEWILLPQWIQCKQQLSCTSQLFRWSIQLFKLALYFSHSPGGSISKEKYIKKAICVLFNAWLLKIPIYCWITPLSPFYVKYRTIL